MWVCPLTMTMTAPPPFNYEEMTVHACLPDIRSLSDAEKSLEAQLRVDRQLRQLRMDLWKLTGQYLPADQLELRIKDAEERLKLLRDRIVNLLRESCRTCPEKTECKVRMS